MKVEKIRPRLQLAQQHLKFRLLHALLFAARTRAKAAL
jgi:hypothetical protein